MADSDIDIIAKSKKYWNEFSEEYFQDTSISIEDFHYGPLLPGNSALHLLPEISSTTKCLEIGCGGAQNSIYLNLRGAQCIALDVAEEQIDYAHKLCTSSNATVKLLTMAMENLNTIDDNEFDLIHSTYGLCFSPNPGLVISQASKLLKRGGILLISLPHPLSAGEPLELDNDYGVFISNGYTPTPDCRFDENGTEQVRSFFHSFSTMSEWMTNANLVIQSINEPKLANPPDSAPFQCPQWEEYRPLFEKIPGTVIIKATKV